LIEEFAITNGLATRLVASNQIHASWRLSQATKEFINRYFEKPYNQFFQILRIYDITLIEFNGNNANQFYEIMLRPEQDEWLVKGLKTNRVYCLELGIKLSGASFFPLIRSHSIEVPGPTSMYLTDWNVAAKLRHSEEDNLPTWSGQVSTYSYYEQLDRENGQVRAREKCNKISKSLKAPKSLGSSHKEVASFANADELSNAVGERKAWSKLKIIMLTWEYPPNVVGGLARHVDGLSRSLVKMDCEIHIVTTQTGNLKSYEVMEGVHVHRIKPLHEQEPQFLTWVAGLNNVMIEKVVELNKVHQFDLVHAHDWLVSSASLVIKHYLKLPLVATIHSTEHGRNNGVYTEMQAFIHEKERQLVEEANQLIVCSEFMTKELNQVFNIKGAFLSVIPNGIDSSIQHKLENTDELNLDPNKRIIFSIGRMVREKGFDTIIEAAKPLIAVHPNIQFVIAGKGPLLEEYRQIIKERNLEANITFLGYINEEQRSHILQICYLAVFPSFYEPFGIVSLESMAHGKPTIVSNTGGLKGIVQHMKTGLLMEPGDPASLIEQVEFLLKNEPVAKQLGEQGKKIVEKLYSWQRIGIVTRRIYEEARYQEKCL
jgi:glycosyltransferase involved in cell wall biosynthesis